VLSNARTPVVLRKELISSQYFPIFNRTFFLFPFPFAVNIADHVIDILMQDDNTNASLIASAGIDIQSLPTILSFKTEVEKLQPLIQESSSNLDS
jgi:hypothetical protein